MLIGMDVNTLSEGSLGKALSHSVSLALKEFSHKQVFDPFRWLQFWNKELQEATKALDEIYNFLRNVVDNYRSTHTVEEIENDPSILGHIMRTYVYKSLYMKSSVAGLIDTFLFQALPQCGSEILGFNYLFGRRSRHDGLHLVLDPARGGATS
jgi:hypothetical protein